MESYINELDAPTEIRFFLSNIFNNKKVVLKGNICRWEELNAQDKISLLNFAKSYLVSEDIILKTFDKDFFKCCTFLFELSTLSNQDNKLYLNKENAHNTLRVTEIMQDETALLSLKLISNFLYLVPTFREALLEQDGLLKPFLCLDALFLYLRILYLTSTITFTSDKLDFILKSTPPPLSILSKLINCVDQVDQTGLFSTDSVKTEIFKLIFQWTIYYQRYFIGEIDAHTIGLNSIIHPTLSLLKVETPCLLMKPPYIQAIHSLINVEPEQFALYPELESDVKKVGERLVSCLFEAIEQAETLNLGDETDILLQLCSPMILLAILCQAFENVKVKTWKSLIPIDRSVPLGQGTDAQHKLVKKITFGSIDLAPFRDSLCQLYFILCDKDSNKLANTLGYGNVAGFLTAHGLGQNTQRSKDTYGEPINPITGQNRTYEAAVSLAMTNEEKEREAERLFVLFERMRANSTIDVVNPVQIAQQNGDLEELNDYDEESD